MRLFDAEVFQVAICIFRQMLSICSSYGTVRGFICELNTEKKPS